MVSPCSANFPILAVAQVVDNLRLCREHYRLTLQLGAFGAALPGQFVHLCPLQPTSARHPALDHDVSAAPKEWINAWQSPLLRRAYSIADLRRTGSAVELDVIYRVVGAGTAWLSTLGHGDELSLLGPLGQPFPLIANKRHAWLIAGGVGLPPMLWLAERLTGAGHETVAFCGAQTAELLALTMNPANVPDASAKSATLSALEFSRVGVPVVVSTDDGTIGFKGHIGSALASYYDAQTVSAEDVVVYTCGPERMMQFVSQFCRERSMECYVCMERAMACGMGTCQSCVVGVLDEAACNGWRYKLCCKDGPVFPADQIRWLATDG